MLETGPRVRAAVQYEEQEIRAADPLTLVVKIHEIALAAVARARAAVAARDAGAKGEAVNRLVRCFELLRSSLVMETEGTLARDLDRLYDYLVRRVTHAHLHWDDAAFDEIGRHLVELARAWREAASRRTPVSAGDAR